MRGLFVCFVLFLLYLRPAWAASLPVLVTIPPQREWVREIGGNQVEVTVLVPPGANPHTYELSPRQLKVVQRARLYAAVGSGLEFEIAWLGRIEKLNPKLLVVDCSRGVETLEGDPHIWLSLKNVKTMVRNILNGLCKIDPSRASLYRKRASSYLAKLDSLDGEIRRLLDPYRGRAFLTFHPSWGYFARDYGLRQMVIEQGGKEPSPRALMALIRRAKETGIKVVFVSPQFDRRAAEAIARELQGRVVPLDPLAPDYLKNMRRVAEEIARSFSP